MWKALLWAALSCTECYYSIKLFYCFNTSYFLISLGFSFLLILQLLNYWHAFFHSSQNGIPFSNQSTSFFIHWGSMWKISLFIHIQWKARRKIQWSKLSVFGCLWSGDSEHGTYLLLHLQPFLNLTFNRTSCMGSPSLTLGSQEWDGLLVSPIRVSSEYSLSCWNHQPFRTFQHFAIVPDTLRVLSDRHRKGPRYSCVLLLWLLLTSEEEGMSCSSMQHRLSRDFCLQGFTHDLTKHNWKGFWINTKWSFTL